MLFKSKMIKKMCMQVVNMGSRLEIQLWKYFVKSISVLSWAIRIKKVPFTEFLLKNCASKYSKFQHCDSMTFKSKEGSFYWSCHCLWEFVPLITCLFSYSNLVLSYFQLWPLQLKIIFIKKVLLYLETISIHE